MQTFRLKYVTRIPDRRGNPYWYFRDAQKKYHRLPGLPGSPEFMAEYSRLLGHAASVPPPSLMPPQPGTLHELITLYKSSPEFLTKIRSDKTRDGYRHQLDRLSCLGAFPLDQIGRREILALRDKIAVRGRRTADQFIQVTRRLFSFALDREYVQRNPAARVPELSESKSYEAWTLADAQAFEMSNPPPWAMTAYLIARYAAPRRGDVLRMTRANYNGATLTFVPSKTEGRRPRPLVIPVHRRLKHHLDALPTDVGLLVARPSGKPWDPSAFSKALREILDQAGLHHLHFHGLRHMAATTLAELGCSTKEIMAITGHSTPEMVERYIQGASQRTLAASAIRKLEEGG